MPREVAIEMLARPEVHIGGKDRKMFRDALEKHFTSTLQEKPREVKLAFKLQHSTWAQLNKWHKRTNLRYLEMQKRYSRFAEKVAGFAEETPEKKVGESKLAASGVIMALCCEALECIEFTDEWYEYVGTDELPPVVAGSSIVGPNDNLRYAPRNTSKTDIRQRSGGKRKHQNPLKRK